MRNTWPGHLPAPRSETASETWPSTEPAHWSPFRTGLPGVQHSGTASAAWPATGALPGQSRGARLLCSLAGRTWSAAPCRSWQLACRGPDRSHSVRECLSRPRSAGTRSAHASDLAARRAKENVRTAGAQATKALAQRTGGCRSRRTHGTAAEAAAAAATAVPSSYTFAGVTKRPPVW